MKQITVFGSSRCKEGDSEYEFAESVGSLIGKYGHNVATGGYQGTMEAVSKGAAKQGVTVTGVTVPTLFSDKASQGFERTPNLYVNNEIMQECKLKSGDKIQIGKYLLLLTEVGK